MISRIPDRAKKKKKKKKKKKIRISAIVVMNVIKYLNSS